MSYLIIGLAGTELGERERQWLQRDEVGGAILFARNCDTVEQVRQLCAAVREADPDAIIAIDQEGGRVQRIGEPLTVLPPLSVIGERYARDEDLGLELAFSHARLMATEVLAAGVDVSLAPVLDLGRDSLVIGDRAFHADPEVVKVLGRAYIKGMHEAGMAACAKHFPGHGSVEPDTHVAGAVDGRSFQDLAISDLRPFTVAIQAGLEAVMMAHVVYPEIEACPAGYSVRWIRSILRERIGFEGVVLSDDLGMSAAGVVGGVGARMIRAVEAGCDFVLVCRPEDVQRVFEEVHDWPPVRADRRHVLRARGQVEWETFAASDARREYQHALSGLA